VRARVDVRKGAHTHRQHCIVNLEAGTNCMLSRRYSVDRASSSPFTQVICEVHQGFAGLIIRRWMCRWVASTEGLLPLLQHPYSRAAYHLTMPRLLQASHMPDQLSLITTFCSARVHPESLSAPHGGMMYTSCYCKTLQSLLPFSALSTLLCRSLPRSVCLSIAAHTALLNRKTCMRGS
jgi:hypothetical protein